MSIDIDRPEIDGRVANYRDGVVSKAIEQKVFELHDHHPEELAEFRRRILLHTPLGVDEILGNTLLADLVALKDQLPAHIQERIDEGYE